MLSFSRSGGLQHGGYPGSSLISPQLYSRDPRSGYRWLEVPQNLSAQNLSAQNLYAQPQVDEMGRPRVLHAGTYPQNLFAQPQVDEMGRPRVLPAGSYPHVSWAAPGQEGQGSLVPKVSFQENKITYQLCLDMAGFLSDDLTVKMDGRKLTVSGKHKKKTRSEDDLVFHDHREVLREILLPEDADLDAVTCTLTHDGKLCFQVPRKAPTAPKVTNIPVTRAAQGGKGQEKAALEKDDQEGGSGEGEARNTGDKDDQEGSEDE
ncbi:heat shock protein 30D-like [Podarcis raffonei]|uniref:heat shock protein 30D-like n=1 Tax=Podarcis raffonei TaxID=65483 RepID=UPI0023295E67|nr:heat shock protein 30D-like [Podarcis raffonei]